MFTVSGDSIILISQLGRERQRSHECSVGDYEFRDFKYFVPSAIECSDSCALKFRRKYMHISSPSTASSIYSCPSSLNRSYTKESEGLNEHDTQVVTKVQILNADITYLETQKSHWHYRLSVERLASDFDRHSIVDAGLQARKIPSESEVTTSAVVSSSKTKNALVRICDYVPVHIPEYIALESSM
jgi:hypothetical protein